MTKEVKYENQIYCINQLSLFSVLLATASSSFAGWHDWDQWVRNQAIVNRTYQDINDYVGESCKVWVQTVVLSASGGAVYLPQNDPNDLCLWRTDQAGSQYSINTGKSIENVVPGEIVQMITAAAGGGTIEHTAIVLAISSPYITFVQSNINGDKVVTTDWETFDDFYDRVSCYTVYSIE